jgi:hypothetical protein
MRKEKRFDEQFNNMIAKLSCSLIISILDYFLLEGEIKSMLIVMLLLFFSAFWGIVNNKKAWLTALLIWIMLPFANLIKIFFVPGPYLNSEHTYSFLIFSALSLLLCFFGAYSSVFARSIARRAGL